MRRERKGFPSGKVRQRAERTFEFAKISVSDFPHGVGENERVESARFGERVGWVAVFFFAMRVSSEICCGKLVR